MSRTPRVAAAAAAALVLAALLALVAGTPGTAHAADSPASCSVKLGNAASVRRAADAVAAVFAAKVTGVTTTKRGRSTRLSVRVVAGFKGTPSRGGIADVVVTGATAQPVVRSTYLFFADPAGDGFTADGCGGVVRLRKGVTATLRQQVEAGLPSEDTAPASVTFQPVSGSARDLPAYSRLIAPGAGLALLGVLGLILFGRLARERH